MSEHDWWTSSFCSLKIFLFVFSHNNVDTTYIFGCKIGTHSRHDDWSLAALLLLYHQHARFTQPNTKDILTSSLFVVPIAGSQKYLPRRGFLVLKRRVGVSNVFSLQVSWIHRRPELAEVAEASRSRVVIISSGAEVFSSDNRWSVQVRSGV